MLLQVWENGTLRNRLRELIEIFHRRILNKTNHHLLMFFDEKWEPKSDHISYGHDIEASWLMVEAAEALGDAQLLKEIKGRGGAHGAGRLRRRAGCRWRVCSTRRTLDWID